SSGVGSFVAVPTYPFEPSGVTVSVRFARLAVNWKSLTESPRAPSDNGFRFRLNETSVLLETTWISAVWKTISALDAIGRARAAPAMTADFDRRLVTLLEEPGLRIFNAVANILCVNYRRRNTW